MAPLGWGCVNYVSCVRVTLTENTSIYAPIPQTYFTLTLNPDLPSAKATVNLILWKFFLKKKKKCGTHVSWAQGFQDLNFLTFLMKVHH